MTGMLMPEYWAEAELTAHRSRRTLWRRFMSVRTQKDAEGTAADEARAGETGAAVTGPHAAVAPGSSMTLSRLSIASERERYLADIW